MRFLRRKKKKVTITQVPLTVLMREIIYDAMLTPSEGIADLLGLPPISDEVAEMEEQASQDRLTNIAGLLPFIDAHADIAAKIATAAYMLDDSDGEEIPEAHMDQLTQLFRMVSLSAAVSCVSTLANIGLIESRVATDE